jgi:hypothetical protein
MLREGPLRRLQPSMVVYRSNGDHELDFRNPHGKIQKIFSQINKVQLKADS